jgi:RNA-directed DNA polymerase
MSRADAEFAAGMPGAGREDSGRSPRTYRVGASSGTARTGNSDPQLSELLEAVVERGNMLRALHRVESNKGAAGVDGMTVAHLRPYLREHWAQIKERLLDGTYEPQAVLAVDIPKPGGKGTRRLGIPTVVDRLIQQGLHQVLSPIFEPAFSAHGYGFRPGRSAHQAVRAARWHVASGRRWVVDMDLEKFFDRVNHDVLMARVARQVRDKRVLGLIRRYLQSGMMVDGLEQPRTEGTLQVG